MFCDYCYLFKGPIQNPTYEEHNWPSCVMMIGGSVSAAAAAAAGSAAAAAAASGAPQLPYVQSTTFFALIMSLFVLVCGPFSVVDIFGFGEMQPI